MIGVTGKAINEFKKVLDTEENKGLGIKIKARMAESCCSCGPSMQYDMGLVPEGEEGDVLTELSGVKFYLDETSEDLMKDSEIDFMEETGFMVKDNSAPASSCGCGDSHGGGGSCCG